MGGRQFRPRLIPSLVTALLLPVLIGLGFWQLERAEQKRFLEQSFSERSSQVPLNLGGPLQGEAEESRYRRAQIRGRYVSSKQVLLDNQVNDTQAGYHVYTVLQLEGHPGCFLVNRGWVPVGQSREQLPALPTATGLVTVAGILDSPPGLGIKLGDTARSRDGWPAVVQWLDTAALSGELECEVQPLILRLDPAAEGGFVRQWQRVAMTPEKNVSYAVQWFALATALIIIYIVVNLKRPTHAD